MSNMLKFFNGTGADREHRDTVDICVLTGAELSRVAGGLAKVCGQMSDGTLVCVPFLPVQN